MHFNLEDNNQRKKCWEPNAINILTLLIHNKPRWSIKFKSNTVWTILLDTETVQFDLWVCQNMEQNLTLFVSHILDYQNISLTERNDIGLLCPHDLTIWTDMTELLLHAQLYKVIIGVHTVSDYYYKQKCLLQLLSGPHICLPIYDNVRTITYSRVQSLRKMFDPAPACHWSP